MNIKYDLYGLAYECPSFERKENCPFKELDDLHFKEKIAVINNSPDEQNAARLRHHTECIRKRNPL
jgi:hypothetical protein